MSYAELSETRWRATVVELATVYGWRCFFVENSTREITRRSGARVRVRNINAGGAGFPDLVLVRARDRRLIFAELKRDAGPRGGGKTAGAHRVELSPDQEAWLADLRAASRRTDSCGAPEHAGFDVHVWRPSQYQEIERVLR